jgi:ligand-binding sensor domain-containing protein
VLPGADELVVGTDHGLGVRRGGAWTRLDAAGGLSHDVVTALARDPATGDLWVATLRGVTRVSGGVPRVFHQLNSGLANDLVYHVVVDGPRVAFATQGGASVLDVTTGAWATWDHRNSIMHEPWCYAVAAAPGRLFVGLWGGGVVERDLATGLWREHRDPDGEMELDLDRDDGPIHEVSSSVAWDDGVLWQSTYFGVSRFDGRRWRAYTAKDTGLPGDFVQHVAARGRTAWFGTDQGLAVLDGRTCVAYRRRPDGTCEVTTRVDGGPPATEVLATCFPDNDVRASVPGPDDVWLATSRGLSHGTAAPAAPPPR